MLIPAGRNKSMYIENQQTWKWEIKAMGRKETADEWRRTGEVKQMKANIY